MNSIRFGLPGTILAGQQDWTEEEHWKHNAAKKMVELFRCANPPLKYRDVVELRIVEEERGRG